MNEPDIDWNKVRINAAIAVMQAIISSPKCEIYDNSLTVVPRNAVAFADSLVEELKKKNEL